jgi:hypothetical protein
VFAKWRVNEVFCCCCCAPPPKKKPRVVSHYGLACYKKYLNAKEELWKLKYISPRVASHYGLAIYIESMIMQKKNLWKFKYFTNAIYIYITFQKKIL